MSIRIDLQLPQTTLELAPGDAVEVPITLTNHGGVVDAFYIEIGELQPGWYTLPANEVRLFPEQSGTLVVRFHPPAGPETLAGGYPFSVLATSRDNPHEQTLVNGIIILAATPGLLLDLQPRRVQARQALYGIMLTNPGNAPRPIVLRATDPEEALVYTVGEEQPMLVADGATATVGGTPAVVAPPLKLETPLASGAGRLEYALELAAGAAVMVPLQTKARKRIWFGPNQTYQFEVAATPPGVEWEASEAQTVSGEQVYQPLLAGWGALPFALRRALLIGIPLLILALILFLLLRSTGTAPPANNLTPGADTGATQTALALAAQQTASAQQTALALAAQQTAAASAQQTALAAAAGTQTALAAVGQGGATPVAVVPTAVATGVPVNAGVPLIRAFYMVVPGPGAPAGDLTANEPRLGWDVSAAQNLRLDQDALLSDLLGLPNTQLVNYRLVATGTTSVTTTTLGVLLVGPPIIDSLKVSTSTLAAQDIKLVAGQVVTLTQGERATLAWQVKGARTVDLDGTPVPLDAQGTGRFDVTPPGSHTYILHASNASGTVGRAVTLAVLTLTPTPTPTCIVEDYVVRESAQITVVPGTTDIGNHCDDCATSITLPFPYVLYGRPFTQAAVTSNGQIAFGTAAADATRDNSCLPDANAQDAIFAHWDDLRTDRSAGAGIYTSVSGEAPNRLFNIEWRGVYGDNLAPVHFEVRLYESLQQFDVIYATVGEQGRGATVGVQREGRIHRTEYACNAPRLNEGQMLTFYLPGCGPGGPGGPGQPDKTPFVPPTATHPPQEPGNPGGLPTPTETPSATPTITATPQSATATLIAQFTATPTAPATATATVTPTLPPTRERPPKERPTATSTAMPTNTPTNTVTPTNTATPPNTATATVTQTATPACLITNYPSTDVGQSLVATCVTGCFDATITSTLSINTPATIGGIEVTGLNITSTYAAGLQVYLISPQGTTVPLFNRVCGDTPWPAGSTGFTLAESGAALIGSNCPPGASVYQPQGDLTSLIGQPANGTWRLVVTLTSLGSDNITNEAVLYGWGLRISSGAGCPPPPPRRTATATPTPFPTFPPFNSPTATVTPTASTTPFCNITTFTQDVPVSSFLGTPVASSLDVPSGIPFSQIEVTNLVITAPIPANINLSLISPQNTVVQLMTGACPSGPPWTSANTGFSLSDLAGIPIGAACPPGFGTYRPVGSLSTFVGQSSGGAWRLLISGDTATVSSWTLEFIDGTGCGGGLNTVANGGGLLPPTVTPRMTPTAIRTPAQPPGLGPPATPFTGAATATPIAAPASAPPVPPATATPYRKGPPPRGGYADPVGATNSALDGALAADHSLGLLAGWRMTNQLVDIIFKECLLRLWSVPAGASP